MNGDQVTKFQVGDEVSVGGTVTAIVEPGYIRLITPVGTLIQVEPEELTLVERPKRKLRVGSVWEYTGPTGHARWLVLDDQTPIKLTVATSATAAGEADDRHPLPDLPAANP